MKVLGAISTTALFLLLGATFPAFAQDEHHEQEAKPEKQAEKAKPPAKQEEKAKPAKQEEKAKPAKQQEQAKTEKQGQAKPAKQEENAKPAKQQEQAKTEKQQPENKQVKQEEGGKAAGHQHAQRSADEEKRQREAPALRLSVRGGGRIPDEHFRSNFGREHNFRIGTPILVGGYSRFQYSGYYFGFVDAWPAEWYYTDDVYVDFIDGEYYLYNPYYPGVRISITVVL